MSFPAASYAAYRPTATRALARCLAALPCVAAALSAQPTTVETRALAPGVTYRRLSDPRGPWEMHVVRVDLRRAPVTLAAAHARDSLRGRERTSDIARRAGALVAINADFFDLRTGENENQQVVAGEWGKGL